MKIDTQKYKEEGIYLYLEDGTFFDFSVDTLEKLTAEYWNHPERVSNADVHYSLFKTCDTCPFRGKDVMCSAFKPVLPFLERIEKITSCDRATTIYRDKDGLLSVADTDMQSALQYLTNMSIFHHCEDLKHYKSYFEGIKPLRSAKENVQILLMNIFWQNKGNLIKSKEVIQKIKKAIDTTSRSCVSRLSLVCESDAFRNAYVNTHVISELMLVVFEQFFELKDKK